MGRVVKNRGRANRNRGNAYEREIVGILREHLGIEVKRNLSQTRDSGADILLDRYVIECKRRAKIAVYEWMDQAEEACQIGQRPIVVCRGDGKPSLVIMNLADFLPLLGNEIPTTRNVSSCNTQEPS